MFTVFTSCKKVEPVEKTVYEDLYVNLLHSGTKESLTDVKFIDEKDGMVTGGEGTIYTTKDGGNTWKGLNPIALKQDTVISYSSLQRINKDVVWVPGIYKKGHGRRAKLIGTILLKTEDGGKSWKDVWFGDAKAYITALKFYDKNIGFLSTSNADIYKTTNGGESWQLVKNISEKSRYYNRVKDIIFINKNTIVMVGLEGLVYLTKDGGITWVKDSSAPKRGFTKIVFKDATNGYLVGGGRNRPNPDKAFVYKVRIGNNGFTYTNVTDPYYSVFYFNDVHLSANNYLWVCGHLSQIFLSKDSGNTWSDELTKSKRVETLTAMDFPTDNIGYFVGYRGVMLKLNRNH